MSEATSDTPPREVPSSAFVGPPQAAAGTPSPPPPPSHGELQRPTTDRNLPIAPQAGTSGLDTGTVVAIVVIVVGLAATLWLKSKRGMRGTPQVARTQPDPLALQQDATAALAERLETLISLADERIAALEALQARALPEPATRSHPRTPAVSSRPGGFSEPRPIETTPNPATATSGYFEPTTDLFTRRVYEMADSGATPVEIARALEEHTGKIELILSLRRQAVGGRVAG